MFITRYTNNLDIFLKELMENRVRN